LGFPDGLLAYDALLHDLALFEPFSNEQLIMQPINSSRLQPMGIAPGLPARRAMCHINSVECLNKVVEPF
jgi:hypothetical protein